MKTSYIIASVLGVVVIGGGVWYATQSPSQTMLTGDDKEVVIDGKFNGSLFELAHSGKSYKCSVVTTKSGVTTTGTIYVSNNNIRGDVAATVPNFGVMNLHILTDADNTYTWSSISKEGIKAKRVESGTASSSVGTKGQGLDLNQSYNYDCVTASVPASLFTLPADITFAVTK